MYYHFLKFAFVHKYILREDLLEWSNSNLIKGNDSDLFIKISSLMTSDSDAEIIEIFNSYLDLDDLNRFNLFHNKFLSFIIIGIDDWEETQKKLVEYYNFFYDNKNSLFEEEYNFWIKLFDDYHLRREGFKEGCMLMPSELKAYFNNVLPTEMNILDLFDSL